MIYTEQMSQALGIVGAIHSANQAVGAALTEAISLAKGRRTMFVIDVGTLGASANVNFQVLGATTAAGTYTAIPSTAITQVAVNNKIAIVEVTDEAIQALNLGYTYIKGQLTTAVAASQAAVIAFQGVARNEPMSAQNVSYVAAPVVYL